MKYIQEKDFAIHHMHLAFDRYAKDPEKEIRQKSAFDLVTNVDTSIEKYLTQAVTEAFPGDHIQGEEFSSQQQVLGRTWVIDPIDGTVNMARDIRQYGMQLALLVEGEAVMSVVYLPFMGITLWAIAGHGCYCNDVPVKINANATLNNAVISVGDYTHKDDEQALRQYKAVGYVYPRVAKMRMFGTAAMDFSMVATGRTDGTIIMTKNLWDIAPGILLCREAGACLSNLEGGPYSFQDEGVIVGSNETVLQLLQQAFRK